MFTTRFDLSMLRFMNPVDVYVKRLSDLKTAFLDTEVVENILKRYNPPVYIVEKFQTSNEDNNLIFSSTTLFPGTVGREFYFTQGHYHMREFAEIYFCLKGKGILLLKNNDDEHVLDFEKGVVAHIPGSWGHRVVNVGKEVLVFVSIYPTNAGFDYDRLKNEGGFRTRVLTHREKGWELWTQ
ncbi:MAG TPA: glucose-6-phosphate isomerase [Thermotogae bacterium]|nr:glucose-6-phosphate isomerase [Thermotogota bacterium]